MTIMQTEFEFHRVGQGCFYTGQIDVHSAQPYYFVYDCGTKSKRKYMHAEIDAYRNVVAKNGIDMVVISHFHSDHVNGVMKLLKGIKCRKLVIPYYDYSERLILLLSSDDISSEYISLVHSPVTFFSGEEFNIDEIVIVGGPGYDNNSNESPKPINPFDGDNSAKEKKKSVDKGCYVELIEDSSYWKEEKKITTKIGNKKVKVKQLKPGACVSYSFWEFCFYLRDLKNTDVNKYLQSKIDSLVKTAGTTIEKLFEPTNIKKFQAIYKAKVRDLNLTSICMYHGPAHKYDLVGTTYVHPYFSDLSPHKTGTLLTGDIDIKYKAESDEIVTFYHHFMDRISVFQVPHHGSKNNWPEDEAILNDFQYYVINHGEKSKSHPSKSVIKNIKKRNPVARMIHNTQSRPFQYGFVLVDKH